MDKENNTLGKPERNPFWDYGLIFLLSLILYNISARYSFLFHEAHVPRGDPFSYAVGFFTYLDNVQQEFWRTTLIPFFARYNFYWLINLLISLMSPAMYKEPYSIALINFVMFSFASLSMYRLARYFALGPNTSMFFALFIWLYPSLYGFKHPISFLLTQLDSVFNAAVIIAVSYMIMYVLKPKNKRGALLAGFFIGLAVWGRGNSLPYMLLAYVAILDSE